MTDRFGNYGPEAQPVDQDTINVNNINEFSSNHGVIIDGVLLKDGSVSGTLSTSTVTTDNIVELTANHGVIVDSVLLKDNTVSAGQVDVYITGSLAPAGSHISILDPDPMTPVLPVLLFMRAQDISFPQDQFWIMATAFGDPKGYSGQCPLTIFNANTPTTNKLELADTKTWHNGDFLPTIPGGVGTEPGTQWNLGDGNYRWQSVVAQDAKFFGTMASVSGAFDGNVDANTASFGTTPDPKITIGAVANTGSVLFSGTGELAVSNLVGAARLQGVGATVDAQGADLTLISSGDEANLLGLNKVLVFATGGDIELKTYPVASTRILQTTNTIKQESNGVDAVGVTHTIFNYDNTGGRPAGSYGTTLELSSFTPASARDYIQFGNTDWGGGQWVAGRDPDDAFRIGILKDGSAPRMTLTQNGQFLLPFQPKFKAERSTPAVDVTGDGTSYTIIYPSVLYNNGGAYNSTTGIFTAPVPGFYLFKTRVTMSDTASIILSLTGNLNLTIGSADFHQSVFQGSNPEIFSFLMSGVGFLNAGDTAQVQVTANTFGAAKTTDISAPTGLGVQNEFEGILLS